MKKLLYIFAAAAALSAVSCVKENFDGAQEGATTFYGKALDVKTQVLDGHTVWSANDNIKVFYNNTNVVAELKMGENTSSATFEASVGAATDYYAVYPASETASMTDGTMTVTLPATQNGLFGAGHIAVAKAADKTFTFTNVNAFLKMTFASAQYTRIVVESVAGQALAGDLSITFAGGTPAVAATYANTLSSVEVTSETPFAAGDIYISVLPGVTHTQGLLVTCYNGEQLKGTYYVDKSVATEASVTLTFDVFEPNGNYYVTEEGAGNQNGLSLTNAMSVAKAVALIQKAATDEAALKAIDGAVFNFAAGEYVLADEALALSYDAAEPVKLTFKGEEGTVFSGNEAHSIMTISGADVSMEGITITKSVATETKTGAIKVSGENSKLTLSKCTLLENTVNGEQIFCAGVAVSAGAELAVTECEVIGNSAYSASVFYIDGADVNVTATSFEGNWTDDDAGVMLLEGTQQSSFADCEFTSNAAYKHGMIKHASGKTTFANCTFTKNKVYKDCDGGVFTLLADAEGELVLNGGEVSENFAGWGAGVYQETGSSVLTVSDIVFKNNETVGSGVIWSGGSSSMTKCTFDANTAGGTAKSDGHALTVATGADMQLYGCTVMNHSSSNSSTAIVVRDGATLKIAQASDQTKSVIKNNTAAWGGAMALSGTGKAIISDTEFQENHAKGCGVLRIVEKSSVALTDCVFEDNYTTGGNGGAIAHESSGTVTCNRCHFEGNYAQNEGGAIKVDNGSSNLYLNACTFKGNYNQKQPAGTTIQVHTNNSFAMNNCTIADDTYSESNHASEPRISWLSFNEPQKVWMSNNTLIGVPRHNGSPTFGGLLRLWLDVDTDAHLVNNIVVTDDQDGAWSFCQLDKSWGQGTRASVTLHHTKYAAIENVSGTGNMLTYVESPTSSGFSRSSFGELTWDEGACCWTWNGTLTGGNNTNMISKDEFVSAINDAVPDFKSWLESNGELLLDQGGRYRGEDRWWPGAYQDGFIPADDVTVTTFNIRGSNIDEDETSREWANRKEGVFAWFNENQHPFVLTQECSKDQRNEILNNCSAYGAVYYEGDSSWLDQFLGRDTDAPVVTFYKKDEVTVHSSGTFWLVNGAPTTPTQATNQNQQRCATWMKCTYKDKKMVLINTHISYKTKNGATGDAEEMQTLRESEMGVIKTWLSNNYNPSTDGPVVLAGDFNTAQGNSVFTYWRNNNDDCGWYYARDTMYENDKNACDTGRTFNNWVELGGNGQLTIDHQFYSGFSTVSAYTVDREPYAGVQFLSDHWPLTVVYEF